MRPSEFRTFYLQASAWTGGQPPSWQDVLGLYTRDWAPLFTSAQPTMLPSAELPPEFPRFSIRSEVSGWRLAISAVRIDIVWESIAAGAAPVDFAARSTDMLQKFFRDAQRAQPVRLALVARRLMVDPNPARTLASYFCREELRSATGPLNRPGDFELHAHKVYQPQGGEFPRVNSWIRWKTARKADDDAPCVLLEQDLNTLSPQPDAPPLNDATLAAFLARGMSEIDSILNLYLSGNGEGR